MEETFISAYGVILFCKVRRIRYTNYEQARLWIIYFVSRRVRLNAFVPAIPGVMLFVKM